MGEGQGQVVRGGDGVGPSNLSTLAVGHSLVFLRSLGNIAIPGQGGIRVLPTINW